jgi:hypothetical protein
VGLLWIPCGIAPDTDVGLLQIQGSNPQSPVPQNKRKFISNQSLNKKLIKKFK